MHKGEVTVVLAKFLELVRSVKLVGGCSSVPLKRQHSLGVQ